MRCCVLALVFVLAGGQCALAGAWPREKGKAFVASNLTTTKDRDYNGNLYAEYGLTDRFTLGLDVTAEMDPLGMITGDGTLFLRWPLNAPDATHKWAVHLGVGARYDDLEFFPSGEIALAWGRGLQWGERYGWMGLEASYNVAKSPQTAIAKLDGTIGMGLTDKTKAMMQVFLTQQDSVLTTKLAPSLLFSPGAGRYTLQFGAEFPNEGETSFKIGIWMDF
jgi:hypothetical protein